MTKSAKLFSSPARRCREGLLLLREWFILELFGHIGLILLRQIGGT